MEATLSSSFGRQMLGQTPFRVGRAPDNALIINDPQSSAHHMEIAPGADGNSYQITDLNSTNGTFVNEQRLPPNMPRPLTSGDVIRIGGTNFNYEVSGAGYAPTVAAAPPSYAPTVAAQPPSYTPPPISTPPPFTPSSPAYPPATPAYPESQPAYPAAQPAYPQAGYPQPAYPQPAGYPQPGFPPQKKSRVGLWVTLIIILVVLIGGGGALAYSLTRSTPQKTLAAYCDGWKTSNAQEIYNQIDSAGQSRTTLADVQTLIDAVNKVGGVKTCTVSNVQQNGSTATATVTLTTGNGNTGSETDTLIQENGTWKLDSSKGNS